MPRVLVSALLSLRLLRADQAVLVGVPLREGIVVSQEFSPRDVTIAIAIHREKPLWSAADDLAQRGLWMAVAHRRDQMARKLSTNKAILNDTSACFQSLPGGAQLPQREASVVVRIKIFEKLRPVVQDGQQHLPAHELLLER